MYDPQSFHAKYHLAFQAQVEVWVTFLRRVLPPGPFKARVRDFYTALRVQGSRQDGTRLEYVAMVLGLEYKRLMIPSHSRRSQTYCLARGPFGAGKSVPEFVFLEYIDEPLQPAQEATSHPGELPPPTPDPDRLS